MPITLDYLGRPYRRDRFVVGEGLKLYDSDVDGGVGIRLTAPGEDGVQVPLPLINVVDPKYGGIFNGIAEDSAAWNAAIADAYALGGGVVCWLDGGTSVARNIKLKNGVGIWLSPKSKIKLPDTAVAGEFIVGNDDFVGGNTDLFVWGGQYDGNKAVFPATGDVDLVTFKFQNVTRLSLRECEVTGGLAEGIYLYECSDIRFSEVLAHDNGPAGIDASGIHLDSCHRVAFTATESNTNGFDGILINGSDEVEGAVLVRGNHRDGVRCNAGYGIDLTISAVKNDQRGIFANAGCYGCTFRGNFVENGWHNIVANSSYDCSFYGTAIDSGSGFQDVWFLADSDGLIFHGRARKILNDGPLTNNIGGSTTDATRLVNVVPSASIAGAYTGITAVGVLNDIAIGGANPDPTYTRLFLMNPRTGAETPYVSALLGYKAKAGDGPGAVEYVFFTENPGATTDQTWYFSFGMELNGATRTFYLYDYLNPVGYLWKVDQTAKTTFGGAIKVTGEIETTYRMKFPGGHTIEKERGGSQTDWEFWHGTNGSARPNMKMAAGVAALFNAPATTANVLQLWQPTASALPLLIIAHEVAGTGDLIQGGRMVSGSLSTVWRVRADGTVLASPTSAATSGIVSGHDVSLTVNNSVTTPAQFIAGRYTTTVKPTAAPAVLTVAVITFVGEAILDVTALAGVSGSFIGVNGIATQNNATQTLATSYGVFGTVRAFAAGPMTNAYSLYGRTRNDSTGVITNAYGSSVVVQNNSTGTITNGYGYHVQSAVKVGGIFTVFYGLYIADQTVAVTNWAIYTVGVATSRFGGRIAVGGDGSWGNSVGPAVWQGPATTEPTANPATGAIQWVFGNAYKIRFVNGDIIALSKGAAVTSPAGGSVIDAEARAAIDQLRARLTSAGLTA